MPNLRQGSERLRGPLWLHGPGVARLPRRLLPQHHLHPADDLQAVFQRAAERRGQGQLHTAPGQPQSELHGQEDCAQEGTREV